MKTRIGPSLLRMSTPTKESHKSSSLQTQESSRNPTGLPQSKRVLLVRIRSGKRPLRGNSDVPFVGGSLGRLGASELTFHITGIPLNFNNLFFTINPLLSGQINKLQGEKKTKLEVPFFFCLVAVSHKTHVASKFCQVLTFK